MRLSGLGKIYRCFERLVVCRHFSIICSTFFFAVEFCLHETDRRHGTSTSKQETLHSTLKLQNLKTQIQEVCVGGGRVVKNYLITITVRVQFDNPLNMNIR